LGLVFIRGDLLPAHQRKKKLRANIDKDKEPSGCEVSKEPRAPKALCVRRKDKRT